MKLGVGAVDTTVAAGPGATARRAEQVLTSLDSGLPISPPTSAVVFASLVRGTFSSSVSSRLSYLLLPCIAFYSCLVNLSPPASLDGVRSGPSSSLLLSSSLFQTSSRSPPGPFHDAAASRTMGTSSASEMDPNLARMSTQ
ncbi:hypothetical protein VTN00DRAFT_1426 [Thermoascus crustaceus]|uniref:uncharacterized protein n=1 Tax=Thermoascus crustaceus TaxID=5088 RepID=UPI0037446ACC